MKRQLYGTNWLVSPDDHSTAVCVRDGTHLELLYIPQELQEQFGLAQETRAIFRQLGRAGRHRDTITAGGRDILVLADGRTVPLQRLQDGQVISVVSVPPPQERLPVTSRVERLVSALIGAR